MTDDQKRRYSAIPDIDQERLEELMKRIRPVTEPTHREEMVRFYEPSAHDEAFTWGAKTDETATLVAYIGDPFKTLHTFAAPSFFKPTLKEVFAQLPADLDISRANAFHITCHDEFQTIRPEGGGVGSGETYHVGTVQLFWVQ